MKNEIGMEVISNFSHHISSFRIPEFLLGVSSVREEKTLCD